MNKKATAATTKEREAEDGAMETAPFVFEMMVGPPVCPDPVEDAPGTPPEGTVPLGWAAAGPVKTKVPAPSL